MLFRSSHAQTTRIHVDRTVGGNCYYCAADGDIDTGPSAGEETARTVYCLSSLKQLGLATTMYALENDDYIPRAMDHRVKWILVFIPYLGNEYKHIEDYREVKVFQCPSFPRNGVGRYGNLNKDQTVDYVVNAWDMKDPGLNGSSNFGNQMDHPTKLSDIKSPALRIYMADNAAGNWRAVIRNRQELHVESGLNRLDVWSSTHMPASERTNQGDYLTRRVSGNRHRGDGCNNLFFDGHADWLRKDENTPRYWCGAE